MVKKSILRMGATNKVRTTQSRGSKLKTIISSDLTRKRIVFPHQSILKSSRKKQQIISNASSSSTAGRSVLKSIKMGQSSLQGKSMSESTSQLITNHRSILKSTNIRPAKHCKQLVLKSAATDLEFPAKLKLATCSTYHSVQATENLVIDLSTQTPLQSLPVQQSLLKVENGSISSRQSLLKPARLSTPSAQQSLLQLGKHLKPQQSLLKSQVTTCKQPTLNSELICTPSEPLPFKSEVLSKNIQQSVLNSEVLSRNLQQSVLKSDRRSLPVQQSLLKPDILTPKMPELKSMDQPNTSDERTNRYIAQSSVISRSLPVQQSLLKPDILSPKMPVLKSMEQPNTSERTNVNIAQTSVNSRTILKQKKSTPVFLSNIPAQRQASLLIPLKPDAVQSNTSVLNAEVCRPRSCNSANRSILKSTNPYHLQSESHADTPKRSCKIICSLSESHVHSVRKSDPSLSTVNMYSLANDQSTYIVDSKQPNHSIIDITSPQYIQKTISTPNQSSRLTELKHVKLIRLAHSNREPFICSRKPKHFYLDDTQSFHTNEPSPSLLPVRQTELKPVKFIRLSHSRPEMEANKVLGLSHDSSRLASSVCEPTCFPTESHGLASLDELYQSCRPTGDWSVSFQEDQLVFIRADNGIPMMTLRISSDFSVHLIVLKKDATSFLDERSKILCSTLDLVRIFKELEEWSVCKGNSDERLREVILARCRTSGIYISETNAVHSIYCNLLVQDAERCKKCNILRSFLKCTVGKTENGYPASKKVLIKSSKLCFY